ncbi:DNA ligase D [Cupriavidus respiraculi]|uniref:DNA ligase D n=1 Tax=Cupriavidus respiraculi TaxID=195930 RepID=UPI001C9828EE|nr:DNA ligase D [Cupriavidus respiraculi]MBY4948402.1 DNA ligase D [Cupriavidus respiraculi]
MARSPTASTPRAATKSAKAAKTATPAKKAKTSKTAKDPKPRKTAPAKHDVAADPLARYRGMRDFGTTSEPSGAAGEPARKSATRAKKTPALSFVIQKHAARRLHYDFRLELDGTLKSWAIPKGPSLDPADKRMGVHVEDHPLEYASFEGVIPEKQYGAGTVIVWDRGTWVPVGDPHEGYRSGKLKFELQGEKLHGGWTLVKMKNRADARQEPWLLIKERDDWARPAAEFDITQALPDSVLSGVMPAAGATKAKKTAAGAAGAKASRVAAAVEELEQDEDVDEGERDDAPRPAKRGARGKRDDAALPEGARPGPLPLTLAPQLATLVSEAPAHPDQWVYEVKFDGYRILARVDGGKVTLFTRNGHDWTAKLKSLAQQVAALGLPSGWLDGEIVVVGEDGNTDFQALQNAFDSARTDSIQYFVFDLPFYAGHDLRKVPLVERRALLRRLFQSDAAPHRVRFSESFEVGAGEILTAACRLRLEGVIGKRLDAPYVSRRSDSWIKLKCSERQEFVIGGFTEPQGSRTGIGALLLGIHDEQGRLVYAGKVGTGFDTDTLQDIRRKLDAVRAEAAPFHHVPTGVKGLWVRPKLVAEVSFGAWTKDGLIRHSVFHGLRTDKSAGAIGREKAVPPPDSDSGGSPPRGARAAAKAGPAAGKAGRPAAGGTTGAAAARSGGKGGAGTIGGIKVSHADRVIDPSTGLTKGDLVRYYEAVGPVMLPHLAGRPVALVRGPTGVGGELFFQKHGDTLRMPGIRQLDPSLWPEHPPLLEVATETGLVAAAQLNVIEFHTWNADKRSIEKPDRIVFDLDPGEGVPWQHVTEAAALTRAMLEELGLVPFLKTSGGKGLHVVVPLQRKLEWDEVKAFSQDVVVHMARTIPQRFVAKSGPRNRVGKIFIDYLRNGRGATTAAAFSARARPGLGVSMPIHWEELKSLRSGAQWTIADAIARVNEMADDDPWAGYASTRQTLAAAIKRIRAD